MKTVNILSFKTLKRSGELNLAYAKAIEGCGGKLEMLETLEEINQAIDRADGILLPGGNDVNTLFYGEERKSLTQPPHHDRDRFELYLLERAMEKNLPVLGICRGLQVINVKLGGTLYQDLETEMPGSIRHDWHAENGELLSRSKLVHQVSVKEGSRLGQIIGSAEVEVNSLHHQGVKVLGAGLVATAVAPDGLVEAFEKPDYPYLVAVQWHPEELQENPIWKNFITDFIKVCSNHNDMVNI